MVLDLEQRLDLEAGRTNHVLCEPEQLVVKQLLSEAQCHAKQLDQEISRIQSNLDGLLAQRKSNESRMTRFRVALSPQKRVPPEILSEIFLLCLSGAPVSLFPQLHSAPWVFGRVCSRWRAVSLNEPRLWSCLGVDNYRAAHQRHIPTLAKEIFSRGRQSSITLACKARHYGDAIVDLVTSYSPRIQDLSLTLNIGSFVTLFTRPPGGWDRLESVAFEFYREPVARIEDQLEQHAITVLEAAPNLRKVAFRVCGGGPCIRLRPGTQFDCIPWAQLTDVSFATISPASCVLLKILNQCTSLVNLEVSLNDENPSSLSKSHVPSDIVLPELKSLTIDLKSGSRKLAHFLSTIIAPSLSSFTVHSPPWNCKWPQNEFLSFISNSGCSLKCLSLKAMPILTEEYEPLLYALPTLTTATLSRTSPIHTSTLHAMISGEVLPVVEELECRVMSTEAVLDVLEASWLKSGARPGYGGIRHAIICADDFRQAGDRSRALEPIFLKQGRVIRVLNTVH